MAGDFAVDTVWDADTVRVHGDVTVLDGATLTILAGTLVEFQDWYALTVRGRLLALGEPGAPVRFDSDEPYAFAFDSTAAGAWAGIRFPFTRETNAASRLEYCVIEHAKSAGDSCRGGALQVNGFGKLLVVNSILRANAADFGGAIACTHYASPEIAGCLIVENVAFAGGAALHCLDAYPRLVHCTVTANEDRNPNIFDPVAAVYAHQSKPQFAGGILRGNTSQYFEPTQILYGKSYYTTYSNIGDGWTGEGVIDMDPLFLGAGDHPFALTEISPCVDAALPDTTGLGLPPFDLAGSPRIWNSRGDMGAYECVPVTTVPPRASVAMPALSPNYPNPFNPHTTVSFSLDRTQQVTISVYDLTGRQVAVLADQMFGAGTHTTEGKGMDILGQSVSSGTYIVRLETEGYVESQKIMLIR